MVMQCIQISLSPREFKEILGGKLQLKGKEQFKISNMAYQMHLQVKVMKKQKLKNYSKANKSGREKWERQKKQTRKEGTRNHKTPK